MRIATWNAERPNGREKQRVNSHIERMKEVNADIWILTETNADVSPGNDFKSVETNCIQGEIEYAVGENRTTIWSRLPIIKPVPTHDPETTACAAVETPFGPTLFYGTIIPYHAAGGHWPYRFGGETITGKKQWQLHYDAIDYHGKEITRLKKAYPKHHFCFGGDLNQSRDGRRWAGNRQWYGTKLGREKLSTMFVANNMRCVTQNDFFATGQLTTRSMIDHLCLDHELASCLSCVEPWEAGILDSGKRLTDHSGIWIDLFATSSS
ncbi:MAG: endonuclease/exonuclease/phosphatase family protein [Pirellulaceae bacterium]|nr:endonuclease/exonuclease/phosphatase family protein [Pirellulaceae bacterium]